MLANNLTADDEDAVQEELRQLQQEAVRPSRSTKYASMLIASQIDDQALDTDRLPSVPGAEPVSHPAEGNEPMPGFYLNYLTSLCRGTSTHTNS